MHIITNCSICNQDFMYHASDMHLLRDTEENLEIKKAFPIQDETWASRRWNEDRTESQDLSGEYNIVCQKCNDMEEIACFIEEKAEHRGWENAEYMAADKYGENATLQAIQWMGHRETADWKSYSNKI